jgi:hypothetical protein
MNHYPIQQEPGHRGGRGQNQPWKTRKNFPSFGKNSMIGSKSQPGFLSWSQSQSVEDPEIIVDTLEWSSTTEAQAKTSSEAMMANPAGQAYGAQL